MNEIGNYYKDKWLSLSQDQKMRLFLSWDTQQGEGFPIAITALARLVVSHCSKVKIAHANVGMYHGDTYLLKLSLAQCCIIPKSEFLIPEFEGFPVIWVNYLNEWIGGFKFGGK